MSGCNVSDRDGSTAQTRSDRRDTAGRQAARKLEFEDPRTDAQSSLPEEQDDSHMGSSQILDVQVENIDDNGCKFNTQNNQLYYTTKCKNVVTRN